MVNTLFILTLAVGFGFLLAWSFKTLPGERWQIMASVPVVKEESGIWRGINLTYYGLLNANAYGVAVAFMFILMGSVSVPLRATFMVVAVLLTLCVPSSKLIARVVEKKSSTFTVGGASFVGIVLAPWVIDFINMIPAEMTGFHIPVIPALAALSISYAFGEGMGRLACISFGCCYGKPLSQSHPIVRRIFENRSFTFYGKTKKIAYASGMEGEKVIPVQAITSVLYIGTGLAGTFLFLYAHFLAALMLSVLVTQGWRAFSEMLRADYRGEGKISVYQVMGVIAVIYTLNISILFPQALMGPADLMAGLRSIWNPTSLLFLYALWFAIFIYTGRSMVTGASLSFHVNSNRI